MKQVTINVYEYQELNDKAKYQAKATIEQDLYESEQWDFQYVLKDFKKQVKPGYQYSHEEIKDICDKIGYWLTIGFYNDYKFHGARLGEYILKAFEDHLENEWNDLYFDDDDISEHCEANEILFYENGVIYN